VRGIGPRLLECLMVEEVVEVADGGLSAGEGIPVEAKE
jgi:hypothetical protein